MPGDLVKHLWTIIEPVLEPDGFELVEVEFNPQAKKSILRIYIDHPKGVTIDDCELMGRQVGALLDLEDPFPGAYDLEVSSPGINRVLRKSKHFADYTGSPARIKTVEKIKGRSNFKGILEGASESSVQLNVDGATFQIELDNIKKARLDLPEEDLFRKGAKRGAAATGE